MRGKEMDGLKLTAFPKEITSYTSASLITIYKYKQKVNRKRELVFKERFRISAELYTALYGKGNKSRGLGNVFSN
jgi:hypothetical protein